MKRLKILFLMGIGLAAFTVPASQAKWMGSHPELPAPDFAAQAAKPPNVLGWPANEKPRAPQGFRVNLYAQDLPNPREMYVLPNGDVLVAEATGARDYSANQIELFRGLGADGKPAFHSVFLKGLNQPFGMLYLDGWFYVANTDSVWRYPYKEGETAITGAGQKLLDLPTGGHWTRELIANPSGTKIFVGVGSSTNIAENGMKAEKLRANVLEIDPDGKGLRVFASGLRNPVSLSFNPSTHALWAVVNERDRMGDQLPPDYLTHVQEDGFYGWPYSYWGKHVDPRVHDTRKDLAARAITPDFALGDHVAPLSLDFYEGHSFPARYRGGAFIGEHGSWNSSVMHGYQMYFVPFKNGKPSGLGESFLTGFIANFSRHEAYGRPVDVKTLRDGSLLVSDDAGGRIWRVSYSAK